ncbi:MAG: hypothetical protein D3910_20910, partial [Candidatus Electrothrix sp. ATG2]|nr:hypothetical protein [Candidatus Electrothrix sp. ATG2]
MKSAGCTDIFYGIETGSPEMQAAINKHLDLEDAFNKIVITQKLGIQVTASFIIGFPQERISSLSETVNLFLKLRILMPRLYNLQIHLLTPMINTEITEEYWDSISWDEHYTAFYALTKMTKWERKQVRFDKKIFSSYYHFTNSEVTRSIYKLLHWVLLYSYAYPVFFRLLDMHLYGQTGQQLINWAAQEGDALFQWVRLFSCNLPAIISLPELHHRSASRYSSCTAPSKNESSGIFS